MPAKHYVGYYEGFANSALWPALHSRADLIHVTAENYTSYREVNAFMARALMRFSKPEAVFWVHDYHFLTLGAELRRFGIDRPIGFFLHTPWAERHTMAAVPHHAEIVREMLAYDLIGFQTGRGSAEFRGLSARRAWHNDCRWDDRHRVGLDPARHFPDRHRRRRIQPDRAAKRDDAPRGIAAAREPARRKARRWVSIVWTIPKGWPTASALSTDCWKTSPA